MMLWYGGPGADDEAIVRAVVIGFVALAIIVPFTGILMLRSKRMMIQGFGGLLIFTGVLLLALLLTFMRAC